MKFLLGLLLPVVAWAFPEMVRNGYVNCATCHYSPSGGGILTPYGRQLSREVLSTKGKEGEEAFLYGLVKLPEELALGGDVRLLESYRRTPTTDSTRFIPMQIDLEAAVNHKKLLVAGTVGRQYLPTYKTASDYFISRRHYASFQATDTLSLRGGRFFPAYGIYIDNHFTTIKRDLGFDQGMESYNIETAWIGEQLNVYATGILGRPDKPELNREKGFALTPSLGFAERYKVGASYYYGFNDTGHRNLLGPWGILGFTPRFFLLSELDFQESGVWGVANYQRLDYEIIQGLHAYLTQEFEQLDFNSELTRKQAYGIGVQFFPRPHLELSVLYQKQKAERGGQGFTDLVSLLFHFYP